MKSFFYLILFVPAIAAAQTTGKSLQVFIKQNWRVIRAVDVTDSSNIIYDEAAGVKKWDMNSFSIYPLDKKTYGFIHSSGAVETGSADSVNERRFLGRITYAGGMECLYEYNDIQVKGNQLQFTFRKWNYSRDGSRFLHFGYHLVCERSKKPIDYPDWATLEKRRGNKISFILTTDDGKPFSGQVVKVSIPLKGYTMLTELYTDKEGKVIGYYPDSYFIFNNNITLFLECSGLRSSVMLEKKNCPAVLKRTMSMHSDGEGMKISPPDLPF
jgi:hypothetical protein